MSADPVYIDPLGAEIYVLPTTVHGKPGVHIVATDHPCIPADELWQLIAALRHAAHLPADAAEVAR